MAREEWDVAIVGAGAAGLAAAHALDSGGARICIVEARERVGGRIYTCHAADLDAPVELGAEFVHGLPDELIGPAQAGAYALDEVRGRPWQFRDGALRPAAGWPARANEIFERLDDVAAAGEDMSFQQFLDTYCSEPRLLQARVLATAYVQGYHAAHVDR